MIQLYDLQMKRLWELFAGKPVQVHAGDVNNAWPENPDFEMIFQKDVAFELGGGKAASANLTCVTDDAFVFRSGGRDAGCQNMEGRGAESREAEGQGTESRYAESRYAEGQGTESLAAGKAPDLPGDQILVYGPDLQEIGQDCNYARICEVLVRETGNREGKQDPSEIFKLLQDLDFVKFHVYGKGFMMRTSGQSAREAVRVSKKALQDGITFEKIGNAMISHYKENPNVLAVRIRFITLDDFAYDKLSEEAKIAVEIRNSLSKIQKGLPTECSVCEIREICNEVEGLRELHFGKGHKAPKEQKKRLLSGGE